MEEIEYLEEYEEIVMPRLLHNSIQEFLPTDDPYDLLPVDPAFDEFIEEDPLCSVYRNDFEFETTQATNNIPNGSTNNNNSATGTITTLSPSITNSVVAISAGSRGSDGAGGSTIVTGDIKDNNMIIVQPGITSTTTLINVHTTSIDDSGNHHLQYVPTEIVETTVTYDNNNQQQNNIDKNRDIQILSEITNNNDTNIIYDNNVTSPAIINNDNGVEVLSCETLGTSAFFNVAPSSSLTQQQNLLTTPIEQTTNIDSPTTAKSNRLTGRTSEYIRATHSSNNSIHTNLSLLGLPLSPPALQYKLSPLQPTSLQKYQQELQQIGQRIHHHNQQQYNSSSTQQIIATNTTNRSKKLSTIYQNSNLYPQLLALNSGLKTRNSTNKFKSLFRNKINDNLKGFEKLKECSMKKRNSNYRLRMDESEIIAIRASALKRDSLQFLFSSKDLPPLKPIHDHKIQNPVNDNKKKITIEKLIPVMSKGSLKQYEKVEKLQVNEIDENSQGSSGSLRNQQQLNEEYINDTVILNEDISNQNDVNNKQQLSKKEKDDKKIRRRILDTDPPLNFRHSPYKILLNDSDVEPMRSDMLSKFSKSDSHNSIRNNSGTLLKIDKLATDFIVAKNTSLKSRKAKSFTPLQGNGNSSYKFRNMMKLKFSKFNVNVTKSLRNQQTKQSSDNNELKAISIGGYKKSEFKLRKRSTSGNKNITTENISKQKLIGLNNNINENRNDKNEKKSSSTCTIKSKTQIIDDVLNSPKTLRVVLPRTSELELSKKSMNILKMDLSNIEKSLMTDLNGKNISIYRDVDEQQDKELEDPLKGTDIDPLQLEYDQIDSDFQHLDKNETYQLEKFKNKDKCQKRSTPIDEFELFAKQQKLNNSNSTDKKYLEKNDSINRSQSESLNLKPNCDENSINTLIKEDNKLGDKEINELNVSKITKNNDNLTKKTDKNKQSKTNINRKSKSPQIIQENAIISKESEDIKNVVRDKEIINKKPTSSIQEKIRETTATVPTTMIKKPEIFTIPKSTNQEKISETITRTITKTKTPEIVNIVKFTNQSEKFTITKYTNQEKILGISTTATIITNKKPAIFTIAKSINQDKVTTTATTIPSEKSEIFTIAKSTNPEKADITLMRANTKKDTTSTMKKNPEISIISKYSKIKPTISAASTPKKPGIATLNKSPNQENIIDTEPTLSPTLNYITKEKLNTTVDTPKIIELVRSKRIASRNQGSTDSHVSSLKDVSFENNDNFQPISHSFKISIDQNTTNSDLIKNFNIAPVIDIIESNSENLKKSKIDDKITELSGRRHNRTSSKNRQIKDRKENSSLTNNDANRLKQFKTPEMSRKSTELTEITKKTDDNGSILPTTADNVDIVHSNDMKLKNDIKGATKKGGKNTTKEEKGTNIEKRGKLHNNNEYKNSIKESKQDSTNLKKTSETPTDVCIGEENKKLSLNVYKPKNEPSITEAEMKAVRRQNRELNLLKIDNMTQHIFIEPTRSSRSRSKRSTGGNLIQIAPQKPAAKIIRRRQSNILQISRKEYDRVVNERRAAIEDAKKEPVTPSCVLIPFNLYNEQEQNLLKIVECERKQLKENKIKKCKIVLDRMQLMYKKPKKLKVTGKSSPSLKIVEKTKDLSKVITAPDTVDSKQTIRSSVDSNSIATAKKRKLSSNGKDVSEAKSIKETDQILQERQDNTKLLIETESTEHIIAPKSSRDKFNTSNLSHILVELPEIPEKTIRKESKTKLIKTTLGKSKNKSSTSDSTTGITVSANSVQVVKEISKKSETTKIKSTNLSTPKPSEKIRISSKFLPLKTSNSNKINDCKPGRLKKYKSTPNLNSLKDEAINNNIKVRIDEATSAKQIELDPMVTTQSLTKKSINLPITRKESESPTPNTMNSKRKLSEPRLRKDDGKKQKLSSSSDQKKSSKNDEGQNQKLTSFNNEMTSIRSTESKKDNLINEIDQTISATLTKTIVQSQKNSKPQIFIAAPENISRRRNSESNVHENCIKENNSTSNNNNLDFSIDSWFQEPPLFPADEMEASPKDIVPEINSILSSTDSADENEDILQPLLLTPTTSSSSALSKTPTTTQTLNPQIADSITTNSYWPLTLTSSTIITNQQASLPQIQKTPIGSRITSSPDISSITAPSTFVIPNIKSINIPAHIVVQTKFLTRGQYMSKLMKNPLNTTNSIPIVINNNLISSTSSSNAGSSITNKNSDQLNCNKIFERISDLLETQIDAEVRRKMQDLIENKTAEDQLRIERLANIKKIGYTSDFGLQMLVFLQNYFFNTPTVMDRIRNIDHNSSINTRSVEKQLPRKSQKITRNEDFSFRKIRLPVQNINNHNKNNLQRKLPYRTPIISKLHKNVPINENNYQNTPLQNRTYNNSTKIAILKTNSAGVIQSDRNISQIGIHNLSKNIPSGILNDGMKIPSLTLRQSTSSAQGEQINTEVFLNSTNNTCEAAITNEPESILPDDSETIAPLLLQTEIKEEIIDESITS